MSFFSKLKKAISSIISSKSSQELINIEDLLIEADFGIGFAENLSVKLKKSSNIIESLKVEIYNILKPLVQDIVIDQSNKPFVITLCGTNGCGKTTTVAKLIYKFREMGLSVDVAACDTFRAAADSQLEAWTNKLNIKLYKGINQDPASLAYTAISSTESDVLIIDTAGRLPTNVNLMNELSKIYRVLNKVHRSAPHMNILVLDATIGQSNIDQVKSFNSIFPITGIILAKMDSGAKGGTIVNISNQFRIPIFGVGLGESEKDLKTFSIDKFLEDLVKG